jgi:hypothetical protein
MGQGSGVKVGLLLSIISLLSFIANDFRGARVWIAVGFYRRLIAKSTKGF